MNTQDLINRDAQNKKTLLASPLLAKATIRLSDGSIRILAVYDQSTRYEFYWTHKTKSKNQRAARKSWSTLQNFARDFNTDYKPYVDFKSFVAWYTTAKCAGTLLSLRVYKARRLAALYLQTDHEGTSQDWTWKESMNTTDPRAFRGQNRRLARNISGRVLDEIWRG